MMNNTYRVRPEFWDMWFGGMSTDEIGNAEVSSEEISRLAVEWGVTVEELMEQVEEV